MNLLDDLRQSTEIENQMVMEKRYTYAADPTVKYVPPSIKDAVPYLDFSALQNAMSALEKTAAKYSELIAANPKPNTQLQRLNKILYQAEQQLMVESGLPRRPWYRHTIYAPGYYTGYGVKTLPGIREAIEQRNWREAREQIEIAAKAVERYTGEIESATRILMMR